MSRPAEQRTPGATGVAPGPRELGSLRRQLLDWYAGARRDLPWRRTRDPYAIWVSEVMLQQTRVETVIPYWERFLARFPTPAALAEAPEEEVLAHWSGLGYYRRARSLQAAAREVVRAHGGRVPAEREAFLALPGVGRYTAGAVLSIAFDRAEPIVDGNVARVFARLFALAEPLGSPGLQRSLWALAARCVPERGAGDRGPGAWNQALMELGATVCTPRDPDCGACPWRTRCAALRAGRVAELPVPAARPAPVDVRLEVLWVERDGRVLLARRPEGGRMAGLWELPTRELGEGLLHPTRHAPSAGGAALEVGPLLGEVRHGITRHRIRAAVHAARVDELPRPRPEEDVRGRPVWHARQELGALGLTGLTKKVARAPFLDAPDLFSAGGGESRTAR